MDSLTENIVKFVDVLRLAGVRVSISESIDAVEALKHVDILNKNEVKAAMSACLAKSEEERKIFSLAFDKYFVPYDLRIDNISRKAEEAELRKQEIIKEASSLRFQDEQIELPDDLMEVYADLSAAEKAGIRQFLQRTSTGKNVRHDMLKDAVAEMIKGRLRNARLKIGGSAYPSQGILRHLTSEAGIIAGEVEAALKAENSLMYKNIGEISDEDVPGVIRLIKLMVAKINRNMVRSYKNSAAKARLDLKNTIRNNLNTGGVLFRLKYKRPRERKSRLLVMCDVSASMYRFSGFVLQLIMGINSSFSSTDSYIFSEDIEHINICGFWDAADIEGKIKASPVWRRGTDIGKALSSLLNERRGAVNSSTIVLLVSDAKTLNVDKTVNGLKLLKSKVKRIFWLNPVPEKEWERIKGVPEFREYCAMLDCSTLEKLARACGSL